MELSKYLNASDLLVPCQSGYGPGSGAETILVMLVNDLLLAMDEDQCLVLSLLSDAFGIIDHEVGSPEDLDENGWGCPLVASLFLPTDQWQWVTMGNYSSS